MVAWASHFLGALQSAFVANIAAKPTQCTITLYRVFSSLHPPSGKSESGKGSAARTLRKEMAFPRSAKASSRFFTCLG